MCSSDLGSPAKGVGRDFRREGSNPSFSATSSQALYRLRRFFIKNRRCAHAAAPPLRKKSRSVRLLSCKRLRNGSLSLPTFCGYLSAVGIILQYERQAHACLFYFMNKGFEPEQREPARAAHPTAACGGKREDAPAKRSAKTRRLARRSLSRKR